jgi:hypothetical protein
VTNEAHEQQDLQERCNFFQSANFRSTTVDFESNVFLPLHPREAYCTVSDTVVECDKLPEAPVTVSV